MLWNEEQVPSTLGRSEGSSESACFLSPRVLLLLLPATCVTLRLPALETFSMQIHAFCLAQLFVLMLWFNDLMTIGLAGAKQEIVCNESLMLQNLPVCGKSFEDMMYKVDAKKWCNLTEFILYYNNFTLCTEHKATTARCFWPNALAEGFITGIHKQFFSNCTSEKVHWEDPPDKIVITLIFIPVLLTVAMIGLVVWCKFQETQSKNVSIAMQSYLSQPQYYRYYFGNGHT